MSLILCRQEPVTVPLYIEDLGIHIYSSQELCYVIYNNPLLVLEGFIDKRLTEFLRSELRMPFLAERVEKWMDRLNLHFPIRIFIGICLLLQRKSPHLPNIPEKRDCHPKNLCHKTKRI